MAARTGGKGSRRFVVGTVGELAAAVHSRREELGFSIVQLAELAGTSRFFVSDLERGKPTVQLDKTMAVVGALQLRVELTTIAVKRAAAPIQPTRLAVPQIAPDRAHDDPEAIACAECGARVRDLARHLATAHSMRTTEYRQRWHLGPDYDLRPRAVAERAARRALARALLRKDEHSAGAGH